LAAANPTSAAMKTNAMPRLQSFMPEIVVALASASVPQ